MKRTYLFVLAAAAVSAAFLCACKYVPADGTTTGTHAKPTGPAPKLVFTSLSHDFGTVEAGGVVEHVFTFKNEGKGELRLQNPRGS